MFIYIYEYVYKFMYMYGGLVVCFLACVSLGVGEAWQSYMYIVGNMYVCIAAEAFFG